LEVGERHSRSRKDAWAVFLKLYLDQRKNPRKVGDTLMFSTHQTILAALVEDGQDATWNYREEADADRVEALNALWQFDYNEAEKAQHDDDKYWEASFYGLAVEDWSHFDKRSNTPIPDLWEASRTKREVTVTVTVGDQAVRFVVVQQPTAGAPARDSDTPTTAGSTIVCRG
jgi:hypothetical protein